MEESGDYPCVKPDIDAVLKKMLSEKMVSFLGASLSVIGQDFVPYAVHLQE